jgi:hypothetical protein
MLFCLFFDAIITILHVDLLTLHMPILNIFCIPINFVYQFIITTKYACFVFDFVFVVCFVVLIDYDIWLLLLWISYISKLL